MGFQLTGRIKGLIMIMIFALVLFGMLGTAIVKMATAYHNTTDDLAAATDVLGTDAAALAGESDEWLGYVWFAIPIMIVLSIVFAKKGGLIG